MSKKDELFDDWPEKYDQWFKTPIGSLTNKFESELVLDFLKPGPGERILDAGCGTGVFTLDLLSAESHIVGLDISLPMLCWASKKLKERPFQPVLGDMNALPFRDGFFDKVISITALEFIQDGKEAVAELFRIARRGGVIVVATLNSLSPWADRRREEAKKGHAIFSKAIFRSPDELRSLAPVEGVVRTVVHFHKGDPPEKAVQIEQEGQSRGWQTGAFVAVKWLKP
jgi:ubiquinone/menaquinone biosynthesis C-methylase UbiE